jgi:bla regulator protein BlaR1
MPHASTIRALGLAGIGTIASIAAVAQQAVPQWQIDAGGSAKFDVASVKLNKAGEGGAPGLTPAHTNIGLSGLDDTPVNDSLLSAVYFPVSTYIGFAYKLTPAQVELLHGPGWPKWADAERFDIEARADDTVTKDQMRLMMQSLLADRFKLVVHSETRQLPIFALVLDKPGKIGPRLIRLSENVPCGRAALPSGSAPPQKYDGYFTPCGNTGLHLVAGRIHLGSQNNSMEKIAGLLGVSSFGTLDQNRSVLDRTGLSGKFDFTLEFSPDPSGPARTLPNFQPDPSGPTFLEALKDQLGLKLVSQTGPVYVLVVDHIEEPSPN